MIVRLKRIPRTGWISHGVRISETESVAEHSFAVALLSLILSRSCRRDGIQINLERVLEMALVHDLAETLTFDINKQYLEYLGEEGKKLKELMEKKAFTTIASKLPVDGLLSVIADYTDEKSLESRIVHWADGLDIMMQVVEYERIGYSPTALDDLWKTTNEKLSLSNMRFVREILDHLERSRRHVSGRQR